MQTHLGLDLGNCNLVCANKEKLLLSDPSVVCCDKESEEIIGVGYSGEQKFRTNPNKYSAFRPFATSLVDKVEITKAIISTMLNRSGGGIGTEVLLSVPCEFSDIQEELYCGACDLNDVKSTHLIYTPIAAIAGTFVSIPPAFYAINIGATQTNLLIVSNQMIRYMTTIPIGGNAFDQAIVDYYLKKKKVQLSLKNTETIKKKIASVWDYENEKKIHITGKSGRRLVNVVISSKDLYSALENPITTLLEAIWIGVSKVPTDAVKAVFDLGIQLSGGGAMLAGLDRMIEGVTGVKTILSKEPITCVATGLGRIFNYLGEDIPKSFRNVSEIYLKNATTKGEVQNENET